MHPIIADTCRQTVCARYLMNIELRNLEERRISEGAPIPFPDNRQKHYKRTNAFASLFLGRGIQDREPLRGN